jgi:hypothetical protein
MLTFPNLLIQQRVLSSECTKDYRNISSGFTRIKKNYRSLLLRDIIVRHFLQREFIGPHV